MGGIEKHHRPRGTHQRLAGKRTRCVGMKKRCIAIFLLGIFFFGHSVQIRAEAAASIENEIPESIKKDCEEIGTEYDICPELLEAIAYNESRFIEDVTNENCWGLCQVNVKVHAERIEKFGYTEDDMLTSYPNIKVAADYLAELYATYGDDNPIVLSLYSGAGWAAVEKYKEYGTMTKHVENILTRSASYERLHGK